jgi:hypothetical protein
MNNEQIQQQNTLYAWATGKLVMTCLGIAIGCYLYDSALLQKLKDKFFAKKESE